MSKRDPVSLTSCERAAVATQVKRVRLERGITQAALAHNAGVTRQSIGNIEGGRITPQSSTIHRVLTALGTDPIPVGSARLPGVTEGRFEALLPAQHDTRRIGAFSRAISAEVKGLMASKRITQRQFADAIGRNQGYISERVNGLKAFSIDELDIFANLANLDSSALLILLARRAEEQNVGGERETSLPTRQSNFDLVAHPYTDETDELMDE